MALGLKTWIGVAVLACGLVSLTLFPGIGRATNQRWGWEWWGTAEGAEYRGLSTRANEARWRLRPAIEYLTLLERRDSALAKLSAHGMRFDSGPIVLIEEDLPERVRAATDSIVRRQWSRIAQRPNDMTVVVSVKLDTVDIRLTSPRQLRLGVHLGYVLPTPEEDACYTIVNVGPSTARRLNAWSQQEDLGEATLMGLLPTTAPELLGPCAYFAAFGKPGAAVGHWLETVNYAPAILPTWVRDPPYRDVAKVYRTRQTLPSLYRYSEYRYADLYPCASGDRARCRSAVLASTQEFLSVRYNIELATTRPRGVISAYRYAWARTHPLGLGVRSYLSDLLAEMGNDRFAQFWASDTQVDTAFANAFGLPLEDWTMRWAQEQLGTPLRGPATTSGALAQALALATLFVTLGVMYGARREIV